MHAPGSGEQQGGGRRRHYRRSLSCPTSLESLCEQALSLETTPCSVLQLNSLDDEVAVALRRTLHETQREILRAVEAGVLARRGGGGGGTASGGRRTTSDSGGVRRCCVAVHHAASSAVHAAPSAALALL